MTYWRAVPFASRLRQSFLQRPLHPCFCPMSGQEENHPEPFEDHVYQPVQAEPHRDTRADPSPHDRAHTMDAQLQPYLTKVQVLTPLSILLNVAALTVCSILVDPSLRQVSEDHVTQFTPNSAFILAFWATLFLFQVGFAVLIVLSQKEFTKVRQCGCIHAHKRHPCSPLSFLLQRTLVNGVGIRLALANLLLGAWAITFVVDRHGSFLAGLVLLSTIGVLLLVTALLLAVKYPASTSRPLDWLFIHVPIKMFLVITLQLDIPQQLFIALGWYGDDHKESLQAIWPSFGIFAGTGALSAIWIFATTDFVWAAAGIYLHFAVLYSKHPPLGERRPEIIASIVLAMVLQGVAIAGSVLYHWLAKLDDNQGGIALGRDPQAEAHAARLEAEAEAAAATARERALAGHDSTNASIDHSTLEEGHHSGGQGVEVTRKLGSP